MQKQSIKINGRTNRWSSILEYVVNGEHYFLMENDTYGDEADYIWVSELDNTEMCTGDNGSTDLDYYLTETLGYEIKHSYIVD